MIVKSAAGALIQIREYVPADFDTLFSLFKSTVRIVCARDYTREQCASWTDCADAELWKKTLCTHYTLVAEVGDTITGFADLDGTYFDRLYVHQKWQGKGIASVLSEALESHAYLCGERILTVHASITARSFFEKRGYRIILEQQVKRNGQLLTNYLMQKALS